MNDDELISTVLGAIRRLEARREADDQFRALTVDSLPRRHVDGSTIYFQSDDSRVRIEVTVNRETGEILSSAFTLAPPRAAPNI
jgi:hypothetical protein